MLIHFAVGEIPAEFRRNGVTGSAELRLDEKIVKLQDPFKFSTHFQLKQTKSWTTETDGHDITIVKRGPRFVSGLRTNSFTVSVDGEVVAEASGR